MCGGDGWVEGNWVGRSVSQETISTSFNLTGILCIFSSLLHQNCLMGRSGKCSGSNNFPLRTLKDEEKVCFLKSGEKTETDFQLRTITFHVPVKIFLVQTVHFLKNCRNDSVLAS